MTDSVCEATMRDGNLNYRTINTNGAGL